MTPRRARITAIEQSNADGARITANTRSTSWDTYYDHVSTNAASAYYGFSIMIWNFCLLIALFMRYYEWLCLMMWPMMVCVVCGVELDG